jgi:hypothetical protein
MKNEEETKLTTGDTAESSKECNTSNPAMNIRFDTDKTLIALVKDSLNSGSSPTIRMRKREKEKAFQEERKQFWKDIYIASINNEHCRSFKNFHYADVALEEFDKRFQKTSQKKSES